MCQCVDLCIGLCPSMWVCLKARGFWSGTQVTGNCEQLTWILGVKLRSSARVLQARNQWVTSLAQCGFLIRLELWIYFFMVFLVLSAAYDLWLASWLTVVIWWRWYLPSFSIINLVFLPFHILATRNECNLYSRGEGLSFRRIMGKFVDKCSSHHNNK